MALFLLDVFLILSGSKKALYINTAYTGFQCFFLTYWILIEQN